MIFLLWIINCVSLFLVIKSIHLSLKKWQVIIICILQALLLLVMCDYLFSLLLFYITIYLLKFMIFQFIENNRKWQLVITNINFVTVVSSHLIVIALIALYYQTDMSSVIHSHRFSFVSFLLFIIIDTIINFVAVIMSEKITNIFTHTVYEQCLDFNKFLWFSGLFVITQSVLCQYDHFPIYISIFLICNDGLLLIIIYCFLHNFHETVEKSYIEEENERLLNESIQRRKSMENMKKYADIDILTKAYSRQYTMKFIQTLIDHHIPFSLVFIDLDQLKHINDVYGHSAGDQYLRHFVESIDAFLDDGDILGRIGGDEFLYIMKNRKIENAKKHMNIIYENIKAQTGHGTYFSYGVVEYDSMKHNLETLLKEADMQMYIQKSEHRRRGIHVK